MACEDCLHWTEPRGTGNWGLCKPKSGLLPFWAAYSLPDMHTQTLRTEGTVCDGFEQKNAA